MKEKVTPFHPKDLFIGSLFTKKLVHSLSGFKLKISSNYTIPPLKISHLYPKFSPPIKGISKITSYLFYKIPTIVPYAPMGIESKKKNNK